MKPIVGKPESPDRKLRPFEKWILGGVIALLSVALGVLLYMNFFPSRPEPLREPSTTDASRPVPAPSEIRSSPASQPDDAGVVRVTLYFERKDSDLLFSEVREIRGARTKTERIRVALEELVRGPSSADLLPVTPKGTALLDLFLMPDGLLQLNFNQEFSTQHPGGASSEIHTLFAIVDTVAANFPDIRAVQFLIDGRQVQTLSGHVSIQHPLRPNWSLLNSQ